MKPQQVDLECDFDGMPEKAPPPPPGTWTWRQGSCSSRPPKLGKSTPGSRFFLLKKGKTRTTGVSPKNAT